MKRCGLCAKDLDGVRYFDVPKDFYYLKYYLKDKKITFPSGVRRIHVCTECLMKMWKRDVLKLLIGEKDVKTDEM